MTLRNLLVTLTVVRADAKQPLVAVYSQRNHTFRYSRQDMSGAAERTRAHECSTGYSPLFDVR